MIDLPPNYGEPFTQERFRYEVEEDNFCAGTVFRKQHPEGVIYSDPADIGPSKYTDVFPLDDSDGFGVEHPVPLNGEWNDLTAAFQFVRRDDEYAMRLDWLNVQ
jgi:hypothetical protein